MDDTSVITFTQPLRTLLQNLKSPMQLLVQLPVQASLHEVRELTAGPKLGGLL